jgi:hypothetical protein
MFHYLWAGFPFADRIPVFWKTGPEMGFDNTPGLQQTLML